MGQKVNLDYVITDFKGKPVQMRDNEDALLEPLTLGRIGLQCLNQLYGEEVQRVPVDKRRSRYKVMVSLMDGGVVELDSDAIKELKDCIRANPAISTWWCEQACDEIENGHKKLDPAVKTA